MKNNIYSISVTYNPDIDLLNRQIDSLHDQVACMVLVDNGSSNLNDLKAYYKDKLAEGRSKFIVIYNSKNMGLGYAQNVGIKQALNDGATDVLLLDQDSVLKPDFIKNLLESRNQLQQQNIKVGAIGPVYYNEVTGQVYPITKFFGPFIKRIEPSNAPEEATFLIASGCFISTDVLNEVGLMDEKLFIDCIDIDWSFRVIAKGYKLYASPTSLMTHSIGEKRISVLGRSIALHSPLRRYYLFRNSILMIRDKNIAWGYKLREITFNSLRLIIYFSVSKERLRYLKYSVAGFKDGLKGVSGECKHKF